MDLTPNAVGPSGIGGTQLTPWDLNPSITAANAAARQAQEEKNFQNQEYWKTVKDPALLKQRMQTTELALQGKTALPDGLTRDQAVQQWRICEDKVSPAPTPTSGQGSFYKNYTSDTTYKLEFAEPAGPAGKTAWHTGGENATAEQIAKMTPQEQQWAATAKKAESQAQAATTISDEQYLANLKATGAPAIGTDGKAYFYQRTPSSTPKSPAGNAGDAILADQLAVSERTGLELATVQANWNSGENFSKNAPGYTEQYKEAAATSYALQPREETTKEYRSDDAILKETTNTGTTKKTYTITDATGKTTDVTKAEFDLMAATNSKIQT